MEGTISSLRRDIDSKNQELLRLEAQLSPFKAYALERYGGDMTRALILLAEDMRRFEKELRFVESKIRTMSAVVNFEFSAQWKSGNPPQWDSLSPDTLIDTGGGTRAITADFVLVDGRLARTEFHNPENWSLTPLSEQRFRISYRSTAAPGSEVFSQTPDRISGVKDFTFQANYLGHDFLKDDSIIVLHSIDVEFFVNGQASFSVDHAIEQSTAVKSMPPTSKISATFVRRGVMPVHLLPAPIIPAH